MSSILTGHLASAGELDMGLFDLMVRLYMAKYILTFYVYNQILYELKSDWMCFV